MGCRIAVESWTPGTCATLASLPVVRLNVMISPVASTSTSWPRIFNDWTLWLPLAGGEATNLGCALSRTSYTLMLDLAVVPGGGGPLGALQSPFVCGAGLAPVVTWHP